MKNIKVHGIIMMLVALVLAYAATKHYGSNAFPASTPEAIFALATVIIALTGWVLFAIGRCRE